MRLVAIALLFCVSIQAATLGQKQRVFAPLAARLIQQAEKLGYEVTLGEAWRSPEMAIYATQYYANRGIGIANSLHTKRLAIDINLFKNGKYLTNTEDYRPLGEWWEKQCAECRWGGRFVKLPDGNHFSIEHEGAK